MAALRTLTADGSVRLIDLGPMSAHGNVYDGGRLAVPGPTDGEVERRRKAVESQRAYLDRKREAVQRGAITIDVPVARAPKGMLHRLQADGAVHPRCRGGRPFLGRTVTAAEAMESATRNSNVLCRYRWCFRAEVEALGINPMVGHHARITKAVR